MQDLSYGNSISTEPLPTAEKEVKVRARVRVLNPYYIYQLLAIVRKKDHRNPRKNSEV